MRLPEIKRAIFDDLAARTGIVFDESPDSLIGQFVSIFAEREAAHWEREEALFLAPYPATAPDGAAMDLAVSYAGVRRLQPAATEARVVLYGAPGTAVPARSEIESTAPTPDGARPPRFRLVEDVAISGAIAALMTVSVPAQPAVGAVYWFDWNGIRANTVAQSGATGGSVAAALRDALNAVGATATASGTDVTVTSAGAFSGAVSDTLVLKSVGSPGRAAAVVPGPLEVPAGALSRIATPVAGWDSVSNPARAVPGRLTETTADLRQRYALGVFRLGAGTQPSIFANLQQDIAGLLSLAVFENNTDAVDADGRPPHSIEVVAEGGDDVHIARRIYELKAAGIDAFGNTTRQVSGADGRLHTIRFSRPEGRDVWLLLTLLQTNEEVVPGDQAARAIEAIVAAGNRLQPGQDVLLQRLGAAVFNATTGVARATVRAVALPPNSPPPSPGAYATADIAIGPRRKALFSLARTAIG